MKEGFPCIPTIQESEGGGAFFSKRALVLHYGLGGRRVFGGWCLQQRGCLFEKIRYLHVFSSQKKLRLELGESTVTFQEKLILKLLKFAGIKTKTQLWGEDTKAQQENSSESPSTAVTAKPFYFEKLHVEPFRVVVTCNPAVELSDDLQSLKTKLDIPAGFPPLMENASMQFGK